MDRENDDRLGEKILKYTPFIPKIKIKDLAKALRLEAEKLHIGQITRNSSIIYQNKEILNIVKS